VQLGSLGAITLLDFCNSELIDEQCAKVAR